MSCACQQLLQPKCLSPVASEQPPVLLAVPRVFPSACVPRVRGNRGEELCKLPSLSIMYSMAEQTPIKTSIDTSLQDKHLMLV